MLYFLYFVGFNLVMMMYFYFRVRFLLSKETKYEAWQKELGACVFALFWPLTLLLEFFEFLNWVSSFFIKEDNKPSGVDHLNP